MFKNRNLFFLPDLVKIIHVQLSHKGWKLLMLEIFWQDLVLELVFIFYNKCIPLISPLNDVRIYRIFKDSICFYYEVWYFRFLLNNGFFSELLSRWKVCQGLKLLLFFTLLGILLGLILLHFYCGIIAYDILLDIRPLVNPNAM